MNENGKSTLIGRLFIGLILVLLCVPSLRLYRPIRLYVRRQIMQQHSYVQLTHVWTPSWSEAKLRIGKDFEFHDILRQWFSKIKFFGLTSTTSGDVQQSRDGWLFYTTKEERRCMHHTHPFCDEELKAWADSLENWRARLANKGIQFLFVVAPDKHSIYDDLAPARNHQDTPSRMDQLYAYLREHTSVKVVDVRQALLRGKRQQQIYHKTDTHWNDVGAFLAYQDLTKPLKEMFRKVPFNTQDEYVQDRTSPLPFDLARIAGVDDVLFEQGLIMYPRVPTDIKIAVAGTGIEGDASRLTPRINSSNPHGAIPRLLMLRDSFGTALLPFLAAIAQEGIFLWTGQLDWALIETEKPSVVLFEIVERHLQFEYMRPLPI